MDIAIRVLAELEDLFETAQLQRDVWGFSDTDLVPPRLMKVATEIGGRVLGAYDGARIIGFSLAIPGVKPSRETYWHSHMTGVLPGFQNRGIGRLLKLKQREEAQKAGIELIEWTFDPLEIRNAHFNVERLGVVVRRFIGNLYGITSSRLHGGLPTDRLVAEWHVNSPRVRAIVDGGEAVAKRCEAVIEVPLQIDEWRRGDVERARQAQDQIRAGFQQLFEAGLGVVGYQRTDRGGAFQLGRFEDQPSAIVEPMSAQAD
jgi:predicted GNAT superfamily acetyltransferase